MAYDESRLEEREILNLDDISPKGDSSTVTWIGVEGLEDVSSIESLGDLYGIHPLALEDVVSTDQRPKTEDYEDYVFVVLRMIHKGEEGQSMGSEQVSIVFGPDFVISFQERPSQVFDLIRDRIRNGKGRIRKMGSDYLAYALIDGVVDSYYALLEDLSDRMEAVEDDLVSNPTVETLRIMHGAKLDLAFLRKSVWPLREVVSHLERDESRLVKKTTIPFLRDVYDHAVQVIDTVETLRDVVSGMMDLYLSVVSNKMNEVMKVLTIIATVFIPVTFIAGIYGMNFRYMPELGVEWAYYAILGSMLAIGLLMLAYFRRQHWL
jgi:magnesium transporter